MDMIYFAALCCIIILICAMLLNSAGQSLDDMRPYVWLHPSRTVRRLGSHSITSPPTMVTFPSTIGYQYIGMTSGSGLTSFYLLSNIHQDKWGFTAMCERGAITMKWNTLTVGGQALNLVRHSKYHNHLDMIEGTFKSLPTPHQPAGTLTVARSGQLYNVSFGIGANTTKVDGAIAVADNHSIQFFKDGKVVFFMQKLADEYGYLTAIGNIVLNVQKADFQPAHKQIFELA